jgi:putrescine transport system substrate-binding protein
MGMAERGLGPFVAKLFIIKRHRCLWLLAQVHTLAHCARLSFTIPDSQKPRKAAPTHTLVFIHLKIRENIMNKRLLLIAACLSTLAACSPKPEEKAAALAPVPAPAPVTVASAPVPAPAPVPAANTEEKVLNVYNWPDYISKDLIANFEKETGIEVNYQTFESNEALNAKLVAGNSGYDIVVPGSMFAKGQIEAGLLKALDKSQISNIGNLDADIMSKLTTVDPGNKYLVPWAWSFTTVGVNKGKVAKALGKTPMPENAWDLVFNPAYTSKLKSCGIAYLDSPTEVLPAALHYLGKNTYSNDAADHKAAGEMLAKVREDIRLFSSTLIDDLASGKACVALGWAGDISIAKARAVESKSKQEIEALIPKTGGILFFDNMAVTQDAKHPNNAMAFINYVLQPKVSASLTNELGYPTANKAAVAKLDPKLAADKTVVPEASAIQAMVSPSAFSNEARESLNAVYTAFKKGK